MLLCVLVLLLLLLLFKVFVALLLSEGTAVVNEDVIGSVLTILLAVLSSSWVWLEVLLTLRL